LTWELIINTNLAGLYTKIGELDQSLNAGARAVEYILSKPVEVQLGVVNITLAAISTYTQTLGYVNQEETAFTLGAHGAALISMVRERADLDIELTSESVVSMLTNVCSSAKRLGKKRRATITVIN
jgi:hypothetical protein